MRVSELGLATAPVAPVVSPSEGQNKPVHRVLNRAPSMAACSDERGVPLHRLAEVRLRQGVSRRTMARRMRVDLRTVKREEDPYADLPLSVVYRWQKALQVPLVELFSDIEEPLSAPVLKRAKLLRMMKMVCAIQVRSDQPSVQQLAQMLAQQLTELMPELGEMTPWPAACEAKRGELSRTASHSLRLRPR